MRCEHCRQAPATVQVAVRRPAPRLGWFLSGQLCTGCADTYATTTDVAGKPWSGREVLPL